MAAVRNKLALWGLWAFLKENQEVHNQEAWALVPGVEFEADHEDPKFTCGTSACAAGWTSLLVGDRVSMATAAREGNLVSVNRVISPEGDSHTVGRRAQAILGINEKMAIALFHGENTNQAVRKALKRLAKGEPEAKVVYYLKKHNDQISGSDGYFLDN